MALAGETPGASERPVRRWTPRERADEAVTRGIVTAISPRPVGRCCNGERFAALSHAVLADAARRSDGVGRADVPRV